jgi:hypothetical protein
VAVRTNGLKHLEAALQLVLVVRAEDPREAPGLALDGDRFVFLREAWNRKAHRDQSGSEDGRNLEHC